MKAVLMSIKPKWCEKIFSGEKTVEVRKIAPNLETPYKVYVYDTKKPFDITDIYDLSTDVVRKVADGRGKVIGEFVCDKVIEYGYDVIACAKFEINGAYTKEENRYNAEACLSEEEMYEYSKGKPLRGLHISELKIYDKPKELGEFVTVKCTHKSGSCSDCKTKPDCIKQITRPPQSWQYVEEL